MNLPGFLKRFLNSPEPRASSTRTLPPPMPAAPPPPKPVVQLEPYAFLSYSHKDHGLAGQFAAFLAYEEIPPWIDNRLDYGETWENEIFSRIAGCKVFLILMSPASESSEFVKREMAAALELKKMIIPILVDGEPFANLEQYQFFRLLDTDRRGSAFVERLRNLLAPGRVPSRELQERRVKHFLLAAFEDMFPENGPKDVTVTLGLGYDQFFSVKPNQTLETLDELDWMEVFIMIRERLPQRDFKYPVGTDFRTMFPDIQAMIDFLMTQLSWEEIRRL
jgi:hypothetical protein